jgi:hypothetical protein
VTLRNISVFLKIPWPACFVALPEVRDLQVLRRPEQLPALVALLPVVPDLRVQDRVQVRPVVLQVALPEAAFSVLS